MTEAEDPGPAMARLRAQANQSLRDLVAKGVLIRPSALQNEHMIAGLFQIEIDDETYIPEFFVNGCYVQSDLGAVSKALGDLPGSTKLHFFLNRCGSLAGETPLAAVVDGHRRQVLDAAKAFREGWGG